MTGHVREIRALAVLAVLKKCPAPIPMASLRDRLHEELDLEEMEPGSIDRLVNRAIDDLRSWGYDVVKERRGQNHMLRLAPSPDDPATARFITCTSAEATLFEQATATLRELDPTPEPDGIAILKAHIDDRLKIEYGRDHTVEGIVYQYVEEDGQRSQLWVRTDEEDVALFTDAIRRVEVVGIHEGRIDDGSPSPRPIPAAPERYGGWSRPPRRPRDLEMLRRAQQVLVAVRQLVGFGPAPDGLEISALAEHLKISVRELDDLAAIVERLDPRIGFDETTCTVTSTKQPSERQLDGAEALLARSTLLAIRSLGKGAGEIDRSLDITALQQLIDRLDEFLSRAPRNSVIEPAPCGANVVAACLDKDAVRVRLNDSPVQHHLRPTNLHWQHYRWWIQGTLDGQVLEPRQLRLHDVVEVYPD